MNETVVFSTDAATLAVFDPAVLTSRVMGPGDWWCGPSHSVPEVRAGRIALFGLGGDGVYKVRITEQGLTAVESAYATGVITLGMEVDSGNVFVGAGECIPGDGSAQPDSGDTNSGAFLAVPAGKYVVAGYSIVWDNAPDWFVEHGQPVPASAPADIVLVLSRRNQPFAAPDANLRFFTGTSEWLFPDEPRRIGPVPGMVLSTSVVLRRDELLLKPCGPAGYRPVVADKSLLRWRDRVQLRVVSVDSAAREFLAEIVAIGDVGSVDAG